MSLSVNSKTYAVDSVAPDLVKYAGPAQTASVKDVFSLGRTRPKPTAVFSGVSRTDGKLTRTVTLTDALTATGEGIAEFKTSIPVGTSGTDIDAFLDDLGAFIASATYKTIVKNNAINF